MRLDLYISQKDQKITRSQAKRLIEEGHVRVNGVVCTKSSVNVKDADKVIFTVPEPTPISASAEDIPLDVIYEDADIIVINKAADMVVHPAAGNYSGTLVNALLHHCRDLSGIGGELRPGIVHRLDKGTTGVMVVAKNDHAHLELSKQFKFRTTEKHYYALVYGNLKEAKGTIAEPIGRHPTDRKKMSTLAKHSRSAETCYMVKDRFGGELTLVDIRLMTGRTHQIRVHFAHIGHSLIGDPLYGGTRIIKRINNKLIAALVQPFSRPALHAYKLIIDHPRTGNRLEFIAPVPKDMEGLISELRKI